MKKTILYILLFNAVVSLPACSQPKTIVAAPSPVHAGADSFRLEGRIAGNFTHMDVDITNNIYLITTGNQLKKYNASGDSIAVFNDVKKYGNPSLLDVSNPLKVLLYYKNFSTVVMLDRLLSLRNSINLRQQNIFSVNAIATSYDNNVWLFDEQDYKLKKIDETGKLLQESTDWRLIMNEAPSPTTIIDNNNYVYIYDASKGFYIFDYYGTYKNNLPFFNWTNVAVSNGHLTGFTKSMLHSYQLQSLNEKIYKLPGVFEDYLSAKAMNGKLYILKADGLEIFSIR